MTILLAAALPLAHSGESHWYDTLMFVAPMFVIACVLWWTGRHERDANDAAVALQDAAPEPQLAHQDDGPSQLGRAADD